MNWLLFQFLNYKKITKIEVDYEIITKAGNTILTLTTTINPSKLIIFEGNDWNNGRKEVEKDKNLISKMKEKADEILGRYRSKNKVELDDGVIISGNYIVRCKFTFYPQSENISWKEVKEKIK